MVSTCGQPFGSLPMWQQVLRKVPPNSAEALAPFMASLQIPHSITSAVIMSPPIPREGMRTPHFSRGKSLASWKTNMWDDMCCHNHH